MIQVVPPETLAVWHETAKALSQVLGAGVSTAQEDARAQWRFADPSMEKFGEVVPSEITNNPTRIRAEGSTAL
eukprot:2039299-Karenia_brevis.AAC.1